MAGSVGQIGTQAQREGCVITMTEETPRVWVGCLACYNAGRLVGQWVDAVAAADLTVEQVHTGSDILDPAIPWSHHEELWCLDHEYLPIQGECSPTEAAQVARAVAAAIEQTGAPYDAVKAFVENDRPRGDEWDNLAERFQDSYQGEYDSEEAFAQELAEALGSLPRDYSWPLSYIDWERATRDLFMGDYWSARVSGVTYVFQDV